MSDQTWAFAPAGIEWALILSFIFGGCCSNVWALEAILKGYPKSGTFLTFAQFVFVAVQNLPGQIEWRNGPRLKRRQVPLERWLVQVGLFLAISLMNNYAFALNIPVTLHIIFRSGGLCVSMIAGRLVGRRYSIGQMVSGLMITIGIAVATLSAPSRVKVKHENEGRQFAAGIALMSLALSLSACLGLYQEQTYKRYGTHWKEGLFYSHFLALPFFIPFHSDLSSTFRQYTSSSKVYLLPQSGRLVNYTGLSVPSALLALTINVVTQGICVTGVNRLTARVESTVVNLVLTLRKAVSLSISVWYYGGGNTPGLLVGSTLVLAGTISYSLAASSDAARASVKPATPKSERSEPTDPVRTSNSLKENDRDTVRIRRPSRAL